LDQLLFLCVQIHLDGAQPGLKWRQRCKKKHIKKVGMTVQGTNMSVQMLPRVSVQLMALMRANIHLIINYPFLRV